MAMAESGIVEAERPPDAPNRYRLLREPACGGDPEGPCRPHSEYVAAFPEGWFTAGDLARGLGSSRQAARRHARRAVADGVLESRRSGREAEYRRRRGACPSLRGGGKKAENGRGA
jgi:DNA-binding transcriptional ArsR family regulator